MKENVLALVEAIAKPYESCSLTAYWDCAGYPTNGWGNLLSRERKQDVMKRLKISADAADMWLQNTYPPISQEEADERFIYNLSKSLSGVLRLVKVPLTDEQIAALVDFAFNCGTGNLQISTLLRLINRGEMWDASLEFVKWNKAGGIVYRGLTKRRITERNLFIRGTV